MLDKRLSLDQNIDELLISKIGELHNEYDRLFQSLFRNYPTHLQIIEILSKRRYGFTRQETIKLINGNSGELITKSLEKLEQCDFIRKYNNGTSKKRGYIYQIIDPFILFYHFFIINNKVNSWVKYLNTPSYNSWRGFTFEIVCLNHILNIKKAIEISGIETNVYSWKSLKSSPGAQIDLVIDRSDDVISLCEMKYSTE